MAGVVAFLFACSGNNNNTETAAEESGHVHTEACAHEHGEGCEHHNHCALADSCANTANCDFNHGKGEPCGRGRTAMQESFTVEESQTK